MRITIRLEAFDHAAESAYAVLWLDRERRRWSREGHDRVALPPWGTWENAPGGTLLRAPDMSSPVLMLQGLTLNAQESVPGNVEPAELQKGRADILVAGDARVARAPDSGHWHIQCVDCETTVAEHEIFSDEPDAPGEEGDQVPVSGSFTT